MGKAMLLAKIIVLQRSNILAECRKISRKTYLSI
jgi:hypothetical protein